MSSQKVNSIDDLTVGPYFIYLNYRDAQDHIQTKKKEFSDLIQASAIEQDLLNSIEEEGGKPSDIDIADNDGHFWRAYYS